MPEPSMTAVTAALPISRSQLAEEAARTFGDMVKAVVDVQRETMVIGGELHSDEERVLLESGSRRSNLWGINLYPEIEGEEWIEFDSMINLRPMNGNRSRGVDDPQVQDKIRAIVAKLVK